MIQAMILDDSRSSLLHLKRLVEDRGDVDARTFARADQALEAATREHFDLVIVDHVMVEMDGIAVIRHLRAIPHYAQVPVVMLTATSSQAIRIEALEAGATDFLVKTASRIELTVKLRNLVTLAQAVRQQANAAALLAERVYAATKALRDAEEEMIFRLSLAVEYRDNDTGEHTVRVARYSKMIAEELGLPAERCRSIYLAAPLHDVGKVAIPDHILLKPGSLDPDEVTLMRTHTAAGERILGDGSCDLIRLAAEIAGHHHERWDGAGYPRRIAGTAIPLSARIVAVADVFDALTMERPYKRALPVAEALDVLRAERGRHFDPDCVDAFLSGFARLAGQEPVPEAALPAPAGLPALAGLPAFAALRPPDIRPVVGGPIPPRGAGPMSPPAVSPPRRHAAPVPFA